MTYIFFGLVLTFVDFFINQFDVFPDFIGYALILAGVHQLSQMSGYFSKARIFAAIMLVYSLSDLFHLKTITVEWEFFSVLLVAANLFLVFMPIYFLYLITRGVGDLEYRYQADFGAAQLMLLWKVILIVTVLAYVLTGTVMKLSPMNTIIMTLTGLLIICGGIANIAWLVCFYHSKKRYEKHNVYGSLSLQAAPLVHPESILFALAVVLLIFGLTVLSYSEYANITRGGIYYVENVVYEKYRFSENVAPDSDAIVIDWENVAASIGTELYNDGECIIYISAIRDDLNGGYDIFFKTKGKFGYDSGRMVTPMSHRDGLNKYGDIMRNNIYNDWPQEAILQVTIGDKTYLSKKWCARAQAFDKDGDEIGYPMFAIEHYENGEMMLTDEIRANGNEVQIRLIGLREYEYYRKPWM